VASKALPPEADGELKKWSRASISAGPALPAPKVLPEERSAAEEGAGRYLVQIQKSYMEPKDWKGAVEALETLLKLSLDTRTEARARYYLGEAWANLKDYRRAFVEFLAARDAYPAETRPFLEALFILLEATPD
jgi:TolA-binding protein